MRCSDARSRVHEFLDRELSTAQRADIEEHLAECGNCGHFYAQLNFVQDALAFQTPLPRPSRQPLWLKLQHRRKPFLQRCLDSGWNLILSQWLHLDRSVFWSRVAAVPVSLTFFILLLGQVHQVESLRWSYPVLSQSGSANMYEAPVVHILDGRQEARHVRQFIDTVRGIPFEDSVSVVADIDSGGHVEIDDVLQYPRSPKLLEAIDRQLRSTSFQPEKGSRKLIFTFHTIEVYDQAQKKRGL